MNKPLKTLFVVAVLIAASATMASASTASKAIDVLFNNIKLVVNGVEVQSADEPFIYNGRTYLPVRAVAEALGQDVQWDGETSTVFLGKRPSGNYLTDIKPYYASTSYVINNSDPRNPLSMGGITYAKGVRLRVNPIKQQELAWNLNGQFTSLSGLVGLDDIANRYGPMAVTFMGDGAELASLVLKPGDLPKEVSISVTGVLQLKVLVRSDNRLPDYTDVDLVNMLLK